MGLNSQEVNQMLLNWYAVQGTFYFMQVKLPLCTFHNGAGKLLTCSKEHDCNWSVEPPPRSHTDRDQTNQESYENDGSTTQQQSKSSYLPVYRKKREKKKTNNNSVATKQAHRLSRNNRIRGTPSLHQGLGKYTTALFLLDFFLLISQTPFHNKCNLTAKCNNLTQFFKA